jgi:hypothetical protein
MKLNKLKKKIEFLLEEWRLQINTNVELTTNLMLITKRIEKVELLLKANHVSQIK